MCRSEYDEFHQPVDFKRVFGKEVTDYTGTLMAVRKEVAAREWTDLLGDLLDSILWSELSPQGWANTRSISVEAATKDFDHAYRCLQTMAANGWIVYEKA